MLQQNPNEFWERLNRLGPKKNRDLPNYLINTDTSEIIVGEGEIMAEWQKHFSSISTNNAVEANESKHMKNDREYLRNLMNDSLLEVDDNLNGNIALDEVEQVVRNTKYRKAVGVDGIPYEVLKKEQILLLLVRLLQLCFDSNRIPSEWRKAIITPVFKGKGADKRLPCNYRGISLLSCMYKAYSSVLNNRVERFFEAENYLTEEQNGFIMGRTCEDHSVYVDKLSAEFSTGGKKYICSIY